MAARISWSLPIVTMLAVVVGMFVPQPVRADLEIMLQEDNGSKVLVADNPVDFSPNGVIYNNTFGDFMINFFGVVTRNGTAGLGGSDLMSATTSIKNMGSALHTLTIYVSQDNYTLPVGPSLELTSSIAGSVATGGSGQALAFQSYANNSNGLFDTNAPVATTGLQAPVISISRSAFATGPDMGTIFARTSGEYSVTVTNAITLVVGGTINFSSATALIDATTPAPAGLVLVLTALPALGAGWWQRRRRGKAAALCPQDNKILAM